MPLRKQYILVNSDDRENASDTTTSFTVRLSNPLANVVKLDLVEFILDYGIDLSGNRPSFFLVQSRHLGNDVVTSSGNIGYWRLIPNTASNGYLAYTNSREDSYLSNGRTIQDIDIQLLIPNGTIANNGGKPVRLLLEAIIAE
jgi:hypothetical protein